MIKQDVSYLKILPYAVIALPVAFAGIPIYIFIPEYYHTDFGLSLTVLSIALFCLRFIDAFIDPIIGMFCDRYGHYKKTLIFGIGSIFFAGFWLLCMPVIEPIILNLIIGVFLSTLGFSFFTVYVNTVGALWQKSLENKYKLISLREALTIIGILVASALPFILANITRTSSIGYFYYALIFSLFMLSAIIVFYKWIIKQDNLFVRNNNGVNYKFPLKAYLKSLGINGKYLFISYFISALGSAVPAVMLVFYSKYVLGSEEYTGLYLFLYFIGAILFIPLVRKLGIRYGAVRIWRYAIYIAILIFILALLLSEGDIIIFAIISFLSGACFAAEIILPNLLVAKFIDNKERAQMGNGYYGLLAFLSKFSFALATIISLPFLQISLSSNDITSTIITVKLIYCLLPCALKFIATIMLWRWENVENHKQV